MLRLKCSFYELVTFSLNILVKCSKQGDCLGVIVYWKECEQKYNTYLWFIQSSILIGMSLSDYCDIDIMVFCTVNQFKSCTALCMVFFQPYI